MKPAADKKRAAQVSGAQEYGRVSKSRTPRRLRMSSGMGTAVLVAAIFIARGVQHVDAQTLTVLHSFSGSDGAQPEAGLVRDTSGNLYGTTSEGDSMGVGVVFRIDPARIETVLHSFGAEDDGAFPEAGLMRDTAGGLCGATTLGGTSNFGTIFKIDPSGNETVLHRFSCSDGAYQVET